MRIFLIVAAGLEAVLVALWVGSFAAGGVIGADHQFWYVELPLVFAVIPVGMAAAAILPNAKVGGWREWVFPLGIVALVFNLFGFVGYAAMSGGGM